MITVPERLLEVKEVTCHCATPQITLLSKQLPSSSYDRRCYLNQYVCSFILQGQQWIQFDDGSTSCIESGQFFFLRAGIYSITDIVIDQGQFHSLHFFMHPQFFTDHLIHHGNHNIGSPRDIEIFQSGDMIQSFIMSIQSYVSITTQIPPSLVTNKFTELIELIRMRYVGQFGNLHHLLNNQGIVLSQFMKKHALKPLSIQDYARISGRSESSFRREFKNKFGTTPKAWLTKIRMLKAKELVDAHQPIPVYQIAEQCGFDNVPHFITTYKKHFGETPGVGQS